MRRFVNSDILVSSGTGFLGFNMMSYCNNNPVMYCDPSGNIVTDWDREHLNVYELETLELYTKRYHGSYLSDEGKAYMHQLAVAIRTPYLSEGEFVGDNGYVYYDITERLKTEMTSNYSKLSVLKSPGPAFVIVAMGYFCDKVKPGGEWDLKHSWNLNPYVIYIFDGEEYRFDDIGNMHYGYVGRCLFSLPVLLVAGGVVQQFGESSELGEFYSFGDDPRDSEMIIKGYYLCW